MRRLTRILLPLLVHLPLLAQVTPLPIPLPAEVRPGAGALDLRCPWSVRGDARLLAVVEKELLALHPAADIACFAPTPITFSRIAGDSLLPAEWHRVEVTGAGITVTAPTEEGLFRGSRTLVQLLEQGRAQASLPCVTITDHPRFPWRGMHLDVCRHFFDVDFVKRYIDLLARYKMNTFHWHLTEDQGWRIEIGKYPRLTEVGARRSGSQVGPYSRRAYDSIPYGGYYTQNQIRDVVAYAAARHITIVPEIEMPGHAMAALASYPRLGCTGGPYAVQRGWGVFDDVFCAGNDSVFTVLEDVLGEVMDLFPGEYIHIGGDECPKERWKACTKCQARMKANGLKDEHELQSYFIRRIEKFVNGRGRKIIGWDEILEGGLAPNAAVMSWRGTEGGAAAARQRHKVVMSPGSHCYFDHYQGDAAQEPLAIGGHTTVQKVYAYEPIPAELRPDEHKYVLGAQGNVWTEYITRPENVEYMALPRMAALAEVLWTPVELRDEAHMLARLDRELDRLEAMGVNASRSRDNAPFTLRQGEPGSVPAEPGCQGGARPAVLDGQAPTGVPYTGALTVSGDLVVRAVCSDGHGPQGKVGQRAFRFNRATARPVTAEPPPNERYDDGGAFTLVDGITAGERRVNTEWLGWKGGSTVVTVDLGAEQDITRLSIGALSEPTSWIHLPRAAAFSVSSDGVRFTPVGAATVTKGREGRHELGTTKACRGRWVRVRVDAVQRIPDGLAGAGSPAWMFLDELEVR